MTVEQLQPGQYVAIYQQPITREDYEGIAKLVSQRREDTGDGLSMWLVEFKSEPGATYLRTVNARDIWDGPNETPSEEASNSLSTTTRASSRRQ